MHTHWSSSPHPKISPAHYRCTSCPFCVIPTILLLRDRFQKQNKRNKNYYVGFSLGNLKIFLFSKMDRPTNIKMYSGLAKQFGFWGMHTPPLMLLMRWGVRTARIAFSNTLARFSVAYLLLKRNIHTTQSTHGKVITEAPYGEPSTFVSDPPFIQWARGETHPQPVDRGK